MTIKEALKSATEKLRSSNSPSAYLDAEVLLLQAFKRKKNIIDKSWIYINSNYGLSKKEEQSFFNLIKRRQLHEPIAYITSKKEFYGYDFYVNENVLIPRPETEMIVAEVLNIIKNNKNVYDKFDIVDMGTGSGCIIISILNELSKTEKQRSINTAIANDISIKAIEVAKKNAGKYRLNNKIRFICDDFLNIFKQDFFNHPENLIITANLPYIKNSGYRALQDSVKYEPKLALIGGKDGLKLIKKLIVNLARISKKKRNVFIFIESDPEQVNTIRTLSDGLFPDSKSIILKDLSKKRRFIKISFERTIS